MGKRGRIMITEEIVLDDEMDSIDPVCLEDLKGSAQKVFLALDELEELQKRIYSRRNFGVENYVRSESNGVGAYNAN